MIGCLASVLIWLVSSVALYRVGSGAEFATVTLIIGSGAVACFVVQYVQWLVSRARHCRLAAEYVRLYGPLPESTKASGTRAGGTAGRIVGGSTGYLIGGLIGAAADAYQEREKYRGMTEPQLTLLHELGRLQLVQPGLMSLFMVGALIGSWTVLAVLDMARAIVGW